MVIRHLRANKQGVVFPEKGWHQTVSKLRSNEIAQVSVGHLCRLFGVSRQVLEMALSRGETCQELIHYSDRGSQYSSFQYVRKLWQAGIAISVTQQGGPYESAIAERVDGSLKIDLRLNRVLSTFDEAQRTVEASIRNYNHLRPHMSCGYPTPAAAHDSTQPQPL